jgi:hypothetical protein
MKKILFLFIVIFHCKNNAQPALFEKVFYQAPNFNIFCQATSSIDTLSENSFIVGGSYGRIAQNANDTLLRDSYLLKNQTNGLTKWFRKYHLNGQWLYFTEIKVLKSKDIIVAGLGLNNQITKNGVLMKTDSSGSVIWFRVFPNKEIQSVKSLKNGDITILINDSTKRFQVALLDINGNVKWSKKEVTGSPNGRGLGIIEGKDRNLLFYGYNPNAFCILFDSLGNKINDLNMTNTNVDYSYFSGGINFYDNGYFIVGTAAEQGQLISHVLRLDNSLNVLWYKNYQTANSSCEFFDIACYGKNNLILFNEPEGHGSIPGVKTTGFTFIDSIGTSRKSFLFSKDSVSSMPNKFLLLKNGYVLFTGISWIPNGSFSPCYGITDTLQNGFCGYKIISYPFINSSKLFYFNTRSFTNEPLNYYNASYSVYAPMDIDNRYICSNGPTGPLDPIDVGLKEEDHNDFLKLFPNPADESLILLNNEPEKRFLFFNAKIKITNALGFNVLETEMKNDNSYTLNTKEFKEGVYFLSLLLSNGEKVLKKFIIKH